MLINFIYTSYIVMVEVYTLLSSNADGIYKF